MQADAPSGVYRAVSLGGVFACALRESGAVVCWGENESGQTDAPSGRFLMVSAGLLDHACALRESGEAVCWGAAVPESDRGQADALPGVYRTVEAGGAHTCALRETGEIACWGSNKFGQTDEPSGTYRALSAGAGHTCALRESGAVVCWGNNEFGQTDVPAELGPR